MREITMKEIIVSENAPKAIGPYSQAVRAGNLLFLSGQIPLDPATMQLVEGPIGVQTERVLNNLKAVLEAAGLTLEHVVKTTVFMKNLVEFSKMNEVYAQFFPDHAPARSTIQAAELPRDVQIEIDAIAAFSL
jgi:2-iminobutanoate/2-iminopropanoate deaminase